MNRMLHTTSFIIRFSPLAHYPTPVFSPKTTTIVVSSANSTFFFLSSYYIHLLIVVSSANSTFFSFLPTTYTSSKIHLQKYIHLLKNSTSPNHSPFTTPFKHMLKSCGGITHSCRKSHLYTEKITFLFHYSYIALVVFIQTFNWFH